MGSHPRDLGRDSRPSASDADARLGRDSSIHAGRELKFRGAGPLYEPTPLPPLRSTGQGAVASSDPVAAGPKLPSWSPLVVALPLFALVWVCFAALAGSANTPAADNVASLSRVLSAGVAVVALVLVTLSVVHVQVSGLWPRPAAVAVVVLGTVQAFVANALGSGSGDLWGVAAWVFALIGVTVPLAWVGGQFQSGVRRQRVEWHASLTASWIERARRQASQTVQSVHRHDIRSMLFVIDGAARTVADPKLTPEQRASFAEMLADGVERLSALVDVQSEEIQPFAVDGVAQAVVHAERKAGRTVSAELPSPLEAVGRSADVAAVLRTLVAVTGRKTEAGVRLRGEVSDGAVVIRVEPADAADLPLLGGNWEEIWVETFKFSTDQDEESIDLYVAARLLAEQGADLWSTARRTDFAVRLPAAADSSSEEEA
jgi:hypothetical protein